MLKDYLEQRHISLASGRSSIALEREYWKALETVAYEDGWHNWRDFCYLILPQIPRLVFKKRDKIWSLLCFDFRPGSLTKIVVI